jgi:hypothetical protein
MILRWLCHTFPSLRFLWVGTWYGMLVVGGVVWFVCFPLTAYTLYVANEFPLAYFGVLTAGEPAVDFWLPEDLRRPVGGVCVAFAIYGLFVIYFNVRRLRKLRRGEG